MSSTSVAAFARQNGGLVVLFSVLAISLSGNVWLGWQVRAFQAVRLPPGGVQPGMSLPDLPAIDLDGEPTLIELRTGSTVLYTLSPMCGWCVSNHANIVALANHAGARFRFVGLATDGTVAEVKSYLSELPLPFDVYVLDSIALADTLRLQATPQTIVLGAGGHVVESWVGAYLEQEDIANVEHYFGIELPGLSPSADATQ